MDESSSSVEFKIEREAMISKCEVLCFWHLDLFERSFCFSSYMVVFLVVFS
jgi:hypothetical protein